jgi:8-oxo-dGTP diphosphatase
VYEKHSQHRRALAHGPAPEVRVPLFRFCPQCSQVLPTPDGPPERVVEQPCPACGEVHYRNAKPTASALIVQGGRVLLGRRSIEPFKSLWDVPGGYLEPWEEPRDGVEREVREETGLEIALEQLLGIFVDTYGDPTSYTFNVYYLARSIGGQLQADDDVAELAWFGPDELPVVAFDSGRRALEIWRRSLSGPRQG